MNYTEALKETETIEEGISRLKESVSLRDKMGGAMYFNVMNDDCCQLGNQLVRRGADRNEIREIIGHKNTL